MSEANALKATVACKALEYIQDDSIVGIGTGSTVSYLIQALSQIKHRLQGCVASSLRTAKALQDIGIPVYDLPTVGTLDLYIDGADEVTSSREMIKGGGGALTREKILAVSAHHFICIVDESKWVRALGRFPVAVEVLPMARSLVGRELVKLGGTPMYREGYLTDNGNLILDVYDLDLRCPMEMEARINQIVGVVENGLFIKRSADTVLVAKKEGVLVF
jgi:ribose 5-phosphate isomerase A